MKKKERNNEEERGGINEPIQHKTSGSLVRDHE